MAVIITTVGGSGGGGGGGGATSKVAIPAGTTQEVYINSTSGNDSNDGLGSGTAVQTISRLNEIINGFYFTPSTTTTDTILSINFDSATSYAGGLLDLHELGLGFIRFSSSGGNADVTFTSALVLWNEAPARAQFLFDIIFNVEGNQFSTTYTKKVPGYPNPYKLTTTTITVAAWDLIPKFDNPTQRRFTPQELIYRLRTDGSGIALDKRISTLILGSGTITFSNIILEDVASPNTYLPVLIMGDLYIQITSLINRNEGISLVATGDSRIEIVSMKMDKASATSYRYLALIGEGVSIKLDGVDPSEGSVTVTYDHVFRTTGACTLTVVETNMTPAVSLVDSEYGSNNFVVENIQGGQCEVEYMPTRFNAITQGVPIGFCWGKFLEADSGNFVVQTPNPNTSAASYVGCSFKAFTKGTGFVRIDGFGVTTLYANGTSGTNNVLTTSAGTLLHVTQLNKDEIVVSVEQGTVSVS